MRPKSASPTPGTVPLKVTPDISKLKQFVAIDVSNLEYRVRVAWEWNVSIGGLEDSIYLNVFEFSFSYCCK